MIHLWIWVVHRRLTRPKQIAKYTDMTLIVWIVAMGTDNLI